MPNINIAVTEEEKNLMENYAKVRGVSLSDVLKDAFFDKAEDEYDLKIVQEYLERKAKGLVQFFTLEEVKKELGLD